MTAKRIAFAVKASILIAAGDRVIVPPFWRHEMLNALLVGERRKRLTSDLTQSYLNDLDRLPIDVDLPASSTVFTATQALCRKHRLTAYDAAYLEIAIRERKVLATVDEELRRAALAERRAGHLITYSIGCKLLKNRGRAGVWSELWKS